MPKRKKSTGQEPSKKQKTQSDGNLTSQTKDNHKENLPWPDCDIFALLKNIEENIPKEDSLSYSSRLDKFNWEDVSFKEYSSKECKETFYALSKQVRKFRLLGEIVGDVRRLVTSPKAARGASHPDKPKQPLNVYMIFVEDRRQEVMRQHPNLSPNEAARKLGEIFKMLTPQEREVYENKAKAARQVYDSQMKLFYEKHPELIPGKKSKRSKSVEFEAGPEKPKKPFDLFVQVESEKSEDPKSVILQRCREKWGELGDKDKFFWIKWADELHSKYQEELKEYIKEHPGYQPDKIQVLSKKEKRIKEICSGKPEKPPRSAYHLYGKMMLESDQIKNINSKEMWNYVSEKWKVCPNEEKKEYKIRVEQMWEEYDRNLEEYLLTLPPEERDGVRNEEKRVKNRPERKKSVEKTATKRVKPQTPPVTPMKFFLKSYGGEDGVEAWRRLPPENKKTYEDKLNAVKKQYIAEYEQYLKTLSKKELEELGAKMRQGSSSSGSECDSEED